MAPKKRKASDEALVCASISSGSAVASVLASFKEHGLITSSVRTAQRDVRNVLYDLPETDTPFGTLCMESKVNGKKGSIDVYHTNPAAFMYHALLTSLALRAFLYKCQSANPAGSLTIVLYLDAAVPGNQNRPDHGRGSQCIYWTILEFPPWFMSRACGWMPFSYVQNQYSIEWAHYRE